MIKTGGYSKLISLSIQQTLVGMLGLAFSVAILRQAGLSGIEIAGKLQLMLLVFAIGIVLQTTKSRYIGSGLFLPPISGAIYVQSSIIAVAIGGIPLLIGMTIFAGVCELILSFSIHKLRLIFPPEICGLVILLVGFDLANAAFHIVTQSNSPYHMIIFASTILPILIASVWGKGYIRHLSSIIGIGFGIIAVVIIGQPVISEKIMSHKLPFFALPNVSMLFSQHITFNWALTFPFFLVAFAGALRAMSLGISVQQFNNPHQKKIHYPAIFKAIRFDSLTTILAGFFGINGVNVSPTATTLALASQYTHVNLAYCMATLLLIFACIPKLLYLVATAPLAIVAAIILYYAAFVLTGGIRTIGAQAFGIRQIFIVGISASIAFSALIYTNLYQTIPMPFNMIAKSALSIGLCTGIILNVIFHIGLMRKKYFVLHTPGHADIVVDKHMRNYGEAWHLSDDLLHDATLIAQEITTQIFHAGLAEGQVHVSLHNTTTQFKLTFSYQGMPFKMMTFEELDPRRTLDEELITSGLKNLLRGVYPDKIINNSTANRCKLTLIFHHH